MSCFRCFYGKWLLFWQIFDRTHTEELPIHMQAMQQNLLLLKHEKSRVFNMFETKMTYLVGKYLKNSDLTRLVGRHMIGGHYYTIVIQHKHTFENRLHILSHQMAKNYWMMGGHNQFLPRKLVLLQNSTVLSVLGSSQRENWMTF